MTDSTATPVDGATTSAYYSKLRAKRQERIHQQQQLQLQHEEVAPNQQLTMKESLNSNIDMETSAPPVPLGSSTTRTSARSNATDDARRRQRAEARRLLIEFSGSVWDAVRTNDMPMLRNFFLVEGAARLVQAHSKSVDEFGRTLLHTAAWWGQIEAARFLIANGATLNEIDTGATRLTPLMDAARAGHTAIGLLLLEHGTDPTLRDSSGDNAFHWAARHHHGSFLLQLSLKLEACKHSLLVELWAAKNIRGRTPSDYVRTHPTIFPMLSKRLGDVFQLPRTTSAQTHRHRHSLGPLAEQSHAVADPAPHYPTHENDGSRPTTAQTETVSLSGVDTLGLDVESFVYKSRESIQTH